MFTVQKKSVRTGFYPSFQSEHLLRYLVRLTAVTSLLLLSVACQAPTSNSSTSSNTTTTTATTPHVYIAGWSGSYPVYWKDGALVQLPIPTGQTSAGLFAIAPTANNIYAIAFSNNLPYYYNGSTWSALPMGSATVFEEFADLQVSGTGDVYATGTGITAASNGVEVALLWKNGSLISMTLPTGYSGGVGGGMILSGTSVTMWGIAYTGTNINAQGNHVPVIWTLPAGTPTVVSLPNNTLSNSDGTFWQDGYGLTGVTNTGSSYLGYGNYGNWTNANGPEPYWWNGTQVQFGATDFVALCAFGSGSNIYFAGATKSNSSAINTPAYSLNSGALVTLPLPSSVTSGVLTAVAVSGGAVSAVGFGETVQSYGNSATGNVPLYWSNGNVASLALPSGDTGVSFGNSVLNGSDVYFVGSTGTYDANQSSNNYLDPYPALAHAVYWKNGAMSALPSVSSSGNRSGANSVMISQY